MSVEHVLSEIQNEVMLRVGGGRGQDRRDWEKAGKYQKCSPRHRTFHTEYDIFRPFNCENLVLVASVIIC